MSITKKIPGKYVYCCVKVNAKTLAEPIHQKL